MVKIFSAKAVNAILTAIVQADIGNKYALQ